MDFPKSVPSVGLVDGKFVDEDLVAGTPGSLIPAQWGNAVTEELLNVIESAGLAPDEDNNTQLLAAINAKIADAVPASPPDASTTEKGLVELATDAETQAGTDTLRVVTPAALTARTATETRTGVIELATDAETQAGTDAARAVTPAGLTSRTATETRMGISAISTQALTDAGTDDATIITPKKLRFGFVFSPGTNGYIKLPSWLGGFIMQWGSVATVATNTVVTLPIAFPNAIFGVVGNDNDSVAAGYVAWQPLSLTQIRGTSNGSFSCSYLAFGH